MDGIAFAGQRLHEFPSGEVKGRRSRERDIEIENTSWPIQQRLNISLISDRNILIDHVIAALRTVHDPEIPVNVYDLGLIYRIEVGENGSVEIDMTLTAPGCPVADDILKQVKAAASAAEGVGSVSVRLVFDPPWDQSKMSEEAKLELGFV